MYNDFYSNEFSMQNRDNMEQEQQREFTAFYFENLGFS